MDNWQWWVALAITSAIGFLIGALRDGKKRDIEADDRILKRLTLVEERVAVLEATQVNPQLVKMIVDESLEATNVRLDKIEKTLEQLSASMVSVQIAIASSQRNDNE